MSKIEELSAAVENGKSKLVPNLVQECLDEGDAPLDVLNHGMIDAMSVVGEKFKKNEIFVPEMLVAVRSAKWSWATFTETCTTSARTLSL